MAPDGQALLAHWRLMARYNAAANLRLYASCAELHEAARKAERGAFFGSIHRTLNHLMIGDSIWLARFAGGEAPSTGLDGEPYEAFSDLREARLRLDERITDFFDRLQPAALSRRIAYINNEGRSFDDPLDLLLPHFFNHQTHHRAQVHTMLSQAGTPPPVLDLHRVLKPDP